MIKSRAARMYRGGVISGRDLHIIRVIGKEPEELNAGWTYINNFGT
jgi:hypothetical protein